MTTDLTKYKRAASWLRHHMAFESHAGQSACTTAIALCERMAAGELVERSAQPHLRGHHPECAIQNGGACEGCAQRLMKHTEKVDAALLWADNCHMPLSPLETAAVTLAAEVRALRAAVANGELVERSAEDAMPVLDEHECLHLNRYGGG